MLHHSLGLRLSLRLNFDSTHIASTARAGQVFGMEPSRTLNAEESVARGAALAAALHSRSFKVRPLVLHDWGATDGGQLDGSLAELDSIGLAPLALEAMRAEEDEMRRLDAEVEAALNAKNELEACVYYVRGLAAEYMERGLVPDDEGAEMSVRLAAIEERLEAEDGEEQAQHYDDERLELQQWLKEIEARDSAEEGDDADGVTQGDGTDGTAEAGADADESPAQKSGDIGP